MQPKCRHKLQASDSYRNQCPVCCPLLWLMENCIYAQCICVATSLTYAPLNMGCTASLQNDSYVFVRFCLFWIWMQFNKSAQCPLSFLVAVPIHNKAIQNDNIAISCENKVRGSHDSILFIIIIFFFAMLQTICRL